MGGLKFLQPLIPKTTIRQDVGKEAKQKEQQQTALEKLLAQKAGTTTSTKTGETSGPPGQRTRPSGTDDDDFDRVVRMLLRIRITLRVVVQVRRSPLPRLLQASLSRSWPEADRGLLLAVATLRDREKREELKPQLEAGGFTGDMLDMKELSLNYHTRRVNTEVRKYEKKQSKVEKFIKWLKPGFKVMNSILGSLSTIPGVDIVKEYKEHVEAGYEVAEASQ